MLEFSAAVAKQNSVIGAEPNGSNVHAKRQLNSTCYNYRYQGRILLGSVCGPQSRVQSMKEHCPLMRLTELGQNVHGTTRDYCMCRKRWREFDWKNSRTARIPIGIT